MRLVRAPTPRPRLSKATMRLEAVWRSSGLQIWKKNPQICNRHALHPPLHLRHRYFTFGFNSNGDAARIPHLRRGHHADGRDVPVGHREQNHDDDVSGVGFEDDGELGAVLRTDVAHKEEGDEGEAEQGGSQDDGRADLRKTLGSKIPEDLSHFEYIGMPPTCT